jgi:hypothetical protein
MLKTIHQDHYDELLADDPVRNHIPFEVRMESNRDNFVLLDEDENPRAVVCVAYTSDVATTEQELHNAGNRVAMFYTVWSYDRGAGRDIIFAAVEEIKLVQPSIKRFVTLSPPTDMARRFHFKNGAIELQVNSDTVNYEYTLPTTMVLSNSGMGKNFFAFMVNKDPYDSFIKNGEYFYENKYWKNYQRVISEHPHFLLTKSFDKINKKNYQTQLLRFSKHKVLLINDGKWGIWGELLMNFKHDVNREFYQEKNRQVPDSDKVDKLLIQIMQQKVRSKATRRHMDVMIKNASKHNIDLLVIDYADLVVNSNTEAWKKFAEFTNSDYQVSELVKLGADYHKANINLIKEICPNIEEKLKYLLT